MANILGGGMLGGAKARGVRRHGDIVVGYQYVNDEPALVLWPARPGSQKCGAFVVCLSSAFKYDDDDYLVKEAFKACEGMGPVATKQHVYRNATDIHHNLGASVG